MHILFVTQYDPSDLESGGPAYKIRALCKHLALRGHHITAIVPDTMKESSWESEENIGILEPTIIRLPVLLQYRATTFSPSIYTAVNREIPKADILHILGIYDLYGPLAAKVARRVNVPYVLEPMGMTIPIVRSLLKKRLYLRMLGHKLIKSASRIVATSSQEIDELQLTGIQSSKIVKRRNGLDLSQFSNLPERGQLRRSLGIHPEETLILYLSRLIPKKNPDLLLHAFKDLGLPKVRLLLVGPAEPKYLEELLALAESLELCKQVIFSRPLFGIEKLSAFVDADLFVLPSQNENFGNVVAESIAAGTPVVITDQCGIAPYVLDQAGLVVPVDQDSIRDALKRMIRDHALYLKLKAGCHAVAESLSWEEPIDQMVAIYRDLVGASR